MAVRINRPYAVCEPNSVGGAQQVLSKCGFLSLLPVTGAVGLALRCGDGNCRAFLPGLFVIHSALGCRTKLVFRAIAIMWQVFRAGLCPRYCTSGTGFGSVIKERKALFL